MPIPAIVAGIAALAGAGINAYSQYKQGQRAESMYDKLAGMAQNVEDANQQDIGAYKSFLERQYGSDAGKFSKALADYLETPSYQNEDFSYKGDISNYLDPAYNQRIHDSMRAIEQQGADGSNSYSTDYLTRLGGKMQRLASDEWQNAYNRLMQDRQQQLAAYNANAANSLNVYNAQNEKQQYGVSQYGGARDAYANGYGSVLAAGMQNRQAGLQSQANAMGGATNAQNQQSSWLGQLVGPMAQFAGSYFGAGSGS